MRYVLAVAETGGFTRAAERCHVAQSALSHQVARLERELGARLFDRTSRRVRLTAAGEAFCPPPGRPWRRPGGPVRRWRRPPERYAAR